LSPIFSKRCHLAVLIALAAGLSGCAVVSSKDNAASAQALAGRQEAAQAPWRRDAEAETQARARIGELLVGGITAEESVALCFLAHPEVQLAFETLEISRTELVAASTPPNPLAIVGTRQPGGNQSAFYPKQNVNIGVLQNVLGLVNLPSRRRIATKELERARLQTADRLIALAADVNEAYIAHVAALRVHALREEAAMAARATLELMRQQARGAADAEAALLQERTALIQVESNAQRSNLDVVTTRVRLAQAMGIAGREDGWRVAVEELPPPPGSDPDPLQLEQSALDNRLDIRAARAAVEARLDAAGVQRRWRWLGAAELGVFRESVSGGTQFTGPNALIELPLFDQRQAQLLAADSEARAALRRVEAVVLVARGEIRTRGAELAATRQLLTRYDTDLLPTYRRMRDLSGPGSLEGRRVTFAIFDAQETREGLLHDYWRARAALARSAGAWEALPEWPTLTRSGATAP
jgi:cobalt-zinc-cadmium efflux system outer membrane protein